MIRIGTQFRRTSQLLVALAFVASSAFAAGRPTLRVAKGNTLEFSQYAAANGAVYGPNAKLKINNIKQAWADVSDVVIDGVFEIKRSNPANRATAVFVANKLTIENGGRIVTNGNLLIVFVNDFVAQNNAAIVAFDSNQRKAADGAVQSGVGSVQGLNGLTGPPGNSGGSGESAGVVQIFANRFSGPLLVDLTAQDGGSGSKGGTGGTGRMGFKGENADWIGPDCRHGGGGGGQGGAGGSGGIGGAAGRGGDGGIFSLFYAESASIDPPKNPKTLLAAGKPGEPGQGGDGAGGGEGGLGGDGGGPCGGGPRGGHGAPGGSQGPGAVASPGVNGSQEIIRIASLARVQQAFEKAAAQ